MKFSNCITYSSPHDLEIIVKKSIISGSEILGWISINGKRQLKSLKIRYISSVNDRIRIKIEGISNDFIQQLKINKTLNIFIPDNFILFKAQYIGEEDGQFQFKFPREFIRQERRKKIRLNIGEKKCTINFSKNNSQLRSILFQKNIHNYSTGGCAFNVNRTEFSMFKNNELIKSLQLFHDNLSFITNGIVIYRAAIEPSIGNQLPYINYRIGISFLDLNLQQVKLINRKIIENLDLKDADIKINQ